VAEVVRNLMADFELTMGLAGCRSLAEITPESLVRARGGGGEGAEDDEWDQGMTNGIRG
jgi:isopentenyl diphosphate isomerase/L-lactate dehydrogenase-like FMN-dependent dehydrogenase